MISLTRIFNVHKFPHVNELQGLNTLIKRTEDLQAFHCHVHIAMEWITDEYDNTYMSFSLFNIGKSRCSMTGVTWYAGTSLTGNYRLFTIAIIRTNNLFSYSIIAIHWGGRGEKKRMIPPKSFSESQKLVEFIKVNSQRCCWEAAVHQQHNTVLDLGERVDLCLYDDLQGAD